MTEETLESCFSLASLYASHPHILTTIMYYCSPTTFDAFRYTCKAVYSMSLDPDLLEHHLRTITNRQREVITSRPPRFAYDVNYFDNKFKRIANCRGNLWRLRGLVLQEFLRMQSSWRLGEYKKVVIELDFDTGEEDKERKVRREEKEKASKDGLLDDFDEDSAMLIQNRGYYFDGTIRVCSGTVRGDTFAFLWGDSEKSLLHSFQYARKNTVRKVHGPDMMKITHGFLDSGEQFPSLYTTRTYSGNYNPMLEFHTEDGFEISISEGGYKRSKVLIDQNYYLSQWFGRTDFKELTSCFLRAQFHARNINENETEYTPIDLGYELNYSTKGAANWRVPPVNMANLPNVVLSDHSDEKMNLYLGNEGKCESEGYASGLDDGSNRFYKIWEPRRLEQDISRMGVWKDVQVNFERGDGEVGSTLTVMAILSKNLVKPDPKKRFLLTSSKTNNPGDWIKAKINLVLPPLTGTDKHGKLKLATTAPAAYFRKRVMRDPEIPWADKGFINFDWTSKDEDSGSESKPTYIRTGAMMHDDLVDAEIVTRIVGWTDDGAVWVWDVSEYDILSAGEIALQAKYENAPEICVPEKLARKLGYVNDVRGIMVTGDRLVQRISLFTFGKEQKVHRRPTEDDRENDSGISFLREQDILRRLEKARQRNGALTSEQYIKADIDGSSKTEDTRPSQETLPGEVIEEKKRWRMVAYSFGELKGNSGEFRVDFSGNIEEI